METTRIFLAGIWVSLMLVYLLGDVLRIFSGDFVPGEVSGMALSPAGWLGIAALMLLPILMIMLTLALPTPAARWTNIGLAGFFFLFNVVGLPGYAPFDKFLIIVSLGFNVATIWQAWHWI